MYKSLKLNQVADLISAVGQDTTILAQRWVLVRVLFSKFYRKDTPTILYVMAI